MIRIIATLMLAGWLCACANPQPLPAPDGGIGGTGQAAE